MASAGMVLGAMLMAALATLLAALKLGFLSFARTLPILVGLTLLEQLGPTIGPRMSVGARLRNLGLWAVYLVGAMLLGGFIFPAVAMLKIRPLLPDWTFPGGVLAALLAGDFAYYWFHRFEHRFLWRIHAVHHSPRELSGISGYHHPAEGPLQWLYWTFVAGLLMPNPFAPPLLFAITSIWDQYVHSNTAFTLGRWRWMLADNRFHRIHHSLRREHFDRNFGVIFPWWDVMFRTAYFPKPDEWPDVGILEHGELTGPIEMIARPFLWRRKFNDPQASSEGQV